MNAERSLCTPTGSLPRPDDLVQIMWALGDGIPVDAAALEARVEAAVHEAVRRQIAAGVSIVNDGEMSKPSYATYVKDRLTGFNGDAVQSYHFADLADFPRSAELVAANPGRRKRSAPACTGQSSRPPCDSPANAAPPGPRSTSGTAGGWPSCTGPSPS